MLLNFAVKSQQFQNMLKKWPPNSSWIIRETGQWCHPLTCVDIMHAFDTIMTWKRKPHKLLGVLHSRHWWFYLAGIEEEVLWVLKCIQLQISCHLFTYTSMYCIDDGCVCIDPSFSCCTSPVTPYIQLSPQMSRGMEKQGLHSSIFTPTDRVDLFISSWHIPLHISVYLWQQVFAWWHINVSNHNYTINIYSLLSA